MLVGCGDVEDGELVHSDAGNGICNVEWELHHGFDTVGFQWAFAFSVGIASMANVMAYEYINYEE
jgi:hypothetical protein